MRCGQGNMLSANHAKVLGIWFNDRMVNHGVYKYKRYDVLRHDKSLNKTETYTNGDKYTGSWLNDKPTWCGTMSYANGDVYEGEWRDGARCGPGVMRYANGDMYGLDDMYVALSGV